QPTATTAVPSANSRTRSQPMIQAGSSPREEYENVYADPATGTVEANSAYESAADAQTPTATTNAIATAGPALFLAAVPARPTMPVPMMTPTPETGRSSAERDFRSECSGSSVSRMDFSTFFVL